MEKHGLTTTNAKCYNSSVRFRTDTKLGKRWEALLNELSLAREKGAELLLLQHLVEKVFHSVLNAMMEADSPRLPVTVPAPELDMREKQALRYCVGYIPVKLRRKYRIIDNPIALKYIKILSSCVNCEEVEEECENVIRLTTQWINAQDRGGLFKVNDVVFDFFKAVELVVRQTVQTKNVDVLCNIDIKENPCRQISCNDDIALKWKSITKELSAQSSTFLFEEVINCFVKMRLEAFVRVYIMVRKQKGDFGSKRGQKGLRKDLSSN